MPAHIIQLNLIEGEFLMLHSLLNVASVKRSGDLMLMLEAMVDAEFMQEAFGSDNLNALIDKFNLGVGSIDCGNPECTNHEHLRNAHNKR